MKYILLIISLLISSSCYKTTKSFEQIRNEYRNMQRMNKIIVNSEGNKCIDKNGIFKVNKKFGWDELPIIYSWSCEYYPDKIKSKLERY